MASCNVLRFETVFCAVDAGAICRRAPSGFRSSFACWGGDISFVKTSSSMRRGYGAWCFPLACMQPRPLSWRGRRDSLFLIRHRSSSPLSASWRGWLQPAHLLFRPRHGCVRPVVMRMRAESANDQTCECRFVSPAPESDLERGFDQSAGRPSTETFAVVISVGQSTSVRPVAAATLCPCEV